MKKNVFFNKLHAFVLVIFLQVSCFSNNLFAYEVNSPCVDEVANNFNPERQYLIKTESKESNKRLLSLPSDPTFFSNVTVYRPLTTTGSGFFVSRPLARNNSPEDFQKWKFVDLGNNVVQIINVRSGKAIVVDKVDGAPYQSIVDQSDQGQQWIAEDLGGRGIRVRFVSVLTGQVLAIDGSTISQQNKSSNDKKQKWIVSVTSSSNEVAPVTSLEEGIGVAPNPIGESATITINSLVDDPNATLRILDSFLRERVNKTINIKKGINRIEVNFASNHVARGFGYILVGVNGSNSNFNTAFFKQ